MQAGDAAGVVMEARWLGVDQAFQELNHFLPIPLKANTSFIGRLFTVNAGQYGLELLFAGLPGSKAYSSTRFQICEYFRPALELRVCVRPVSIAPAVLAEQARADRSRSPRRFRRCENHTGQINS